VPVTAEPVVLAPFGLVSVRATVAPAMADPASDTDATTPTEFPCWYVALSVQTLTFKAPGVAAAVGTVVGAAAGVGVDVGDAFGRSARRDEHWRGGGQVNQHRRGPHPGTKRTGGSPCQVERQQDDQTNSAWELRSENATSCRGRYARRPGKKSENEPPKPLVSVSDWQFLLPGSQAVDAGWLAVVEDS